MSLFTTDTHFVVYMNAKDPTPSQELRSREALRRSCRAEQVQRHNALHRAEHHLDLDERASDRRSLLPGASRHGPGDKRRLMVASLRYHDCS